MPMVCAGSVLPSVIVLVVDERKPNMVIIFLTDDDLADEFRRLLLSMVASITFYIRAFCHLVHGTYGRTPSNSAR